MRSTSGAVLFLTAVFVCQNPALCQLQPDAARPPVAKKTPHSMTIHGDTRVDNYFWLREKTNPEVIRYLEAENAYTDAVMKPTLGFQETLYQEMLGRLKQTDMTAPYRMGDWWYYARTERGKQYPIQCRKHGSLEAKEEILLDLNELAKGEKFFRLGLFVVSDDQNLLAFSTDVTGFREYHLFVKDLRAGTLLADRVGKVDAVVWAKDNQTFFYVTEDAAKRPCRLYRHVLGGTKDELVYEEKDELYRLSTRRSRDKHYLFATSASSTTTEVRYLRSDQPDDAPHVVLPREDQHQYSVEHRSGRFFIRTNRNARNFRLVAAPVAEPQPANWEEVVPHRPDVFLEDVQVFAGHCVVGERANGLQKRRVIDLKTGQAHYLEFPEPVYAVFADINPEFQTTAFRYRYQSLITPDSVFAYDMNTRERELLKRTEVRGYDAGQFVSERIFATATDGTRIPISLAYKKGMKRDGSQPLLLYGYGSYGASLPVTFNAARLSLPERGVVYAMAHIRGGREMGESWYLQGKMMNKRNTFTDFLAAADYLVEQKFTARDRLVIQGASAGGLLIGAVLNLRPDLCKAAVLEVPFVDVINTMLDSSLPLTIQEFLEWGNPNNKDEYEYIKSYCPYTNIAARDYPAILVRTSLNDSQVMYWEPAKYVAKMRATRTDHNVSLLKINMAAGHGGASGRYSALKELAFTYAFILNQMGITR